ncbi:MAG: PilZ domain-containing protein [Phycisphaerales bacterium JB040]
MQPRITNDNPIDRRAFERFELQRGYCAVAARIDGRTLRGHAYDISEGGIQFELDHPIEAGTPVVLKIELPPALLAASGDAHIGVPIVVEGNVVWCDTEEPGAARMALAVSRFVLESDRVRLLRVLSTSRVRRAA